MHDEVTGLLYYNARYLHPRLGQFITRDPLGYPDGLNAYAAYHVMHGGLDPTGLEWEVNRNGNARAKATCECGDTVAELAEKIRLEPEEFRKWLKAEDGEGLPNSVDEELGDREFSVPNTVYITKGDVSGWDWKKDWVSAVNFWTTWTIRNYQNDMEGRGYHVSRDDAATMTDIENSLSQSDIHGWFFAGHGYEGLIISHDKLTGDPNFLRRHLHHRLGFVTLYGCNAGLRSRPEGNRAGWLDFVSENGTLRASVKKIYPAFTGWDDVPIVPREDNE